MPLKLSLVMPTRNEDPEVVAATIHCALATTHFYEREILVVDDGSDVPFEFSHPWVTVVRNEAPVGAARARRMACERARGEVLVICDAHMSFAPGWIEAFLEHVDSRSLLCSPWFDYRHSSVDCWGADFTWNSVAGKEFVGIGYKGRVEKPDAQAPEIPMVIGACYVIRRDEFERLGGSNPLFSIYGCEEQDLCLRAWLMGSGVRCVTGARVGHLDRKQDTGGGRPGEVPYRIDATHFQHNQYVILKSIFEESTVEQLSKYYEPLAEGTARSLEGVDIAAWRERIQAQRRIPDADFFRRFLPQAPLRFGKQGVRLRSGERPIKTVVEAVATEEDRIWQRVARRAGETAAGPQPPAVVRSDGRRRSVHFRCLGVGVAVEMTNAKWLAPVLRQLPSGCEPDEGGDADLRYSIRGNDPRIEVGGQNVSRGRPGPEAFERLERSIPQQVATRATGYVFVHAGVVADRDGAIVLLGGRASGRFGLQVELLRQGATHYSDCYAVFDEEGRVHPWVRPPRTAAHRGLSARQWPLEALTSRIGHRPIAPDRLVISRAFPRARWRPEPRSRGQGLLALLEAALTDEERVNAFLGLHAASQQLRVWEGERSDAAPVARFLLDGGDRKRWPPGEGA